MKIFGHITGFILLMGFFRATIYSGIIFYISTRNLCKYLFESLLTDVSEMKETEDLQHREQRCTAVQGMMTVIKYIPHSCATEEC